MDEEAKRRHATTISHTSTTCGTVTTTTTTITTIYKHRHNTETDHRLLLLNDAIELYLNHKYQQAKHIIEELFLAKSNNPPSFEVHFRYACVCNKLQIFDLATKHLDLALSINSDLNAYKNIVCDLIEYNPAHYYYRFTKEDKHNTIEVDTNDNNINWMLHRLQSNNANDTYNTKLTSALLLYEMHQFTQSEDYFKQTLNLYPSSDESHAYYGMLLMDMKRYNAADECFKKAIALNKSQHQNKHTNKKNKNKHKNKTTANNHGANAVNATWHFKYAQLLHKLKQYKECEIHHKEAIEIEPNNARYNDQYAAFLIISARFKEASIYFLHAHKIQSDKKEYRIMHEFAESMTQIKSDHDVDRNFKNLQKQCGTLTDDMLKMKKEFERNMVQNDKKYQTVKKYYKLKKYDKCKDILHELIESNPNHFDYHFLNAKVLESGPINKNPRDLKSIRSAVKNYKSALTINASHGGCLFNFGKLLIKLRKFKIASAQFQAAIESNPNHCAYNMIYAILRMYDPMNDDAKELFDEDTWNNNDDDDEDDEQYTNPMIDYDESQRYFNKCLSLQPRNAECHFKYGLLLIKMGRNNEALTCIRKANKLKNDKEKRYKLRYNKLKNVIEKEKKLKLSGEYIEKEIIMKTTEQLLSNVSTKYDDIIIESESEEEEEEVNTETQSNNIVLASSNCERDKTNVSNKSKKKRDKKSVMKEKHETFKEYMKLGQYKKARAIMKELVSLDSNNSNFANEYGLLLKRDKKKQSESEKFFHIAMSLEPNNIIFKSNYGCLLFDNERYKESESYLKYCVVGEPQNAFYNHMYALLLQRQHKFHESFEYHQKAIELDYLNEKYKARYNKLISWYDQFPRQEKEKMKRMYLEAESHAKHMEFSIAEPTFKKLVEKNPYNLVYVFRYAYVLQRLKKYNLAEKYYKMCLNIEGDHNICHGDYALLLSKLKRYKEADIHYKKCLYTDPENWICRKNYAVSLEIRQRYKEAAKYFREALNINPNDRETNQRYQKLLERIPKLKKLENDAKHKTQHRAQTHTLIHTSNEAQLQNTYNNISNSKKTRRRGRKKRGNCHNNNNMNQEEEFRKAMHLIHNNDIKSAINMLKPLVNKQRKNVQYALEYARCLRNIGLCENAIKAYKHVIQLTNAKAKANEIHRYRDEALYELGKIYENEINDLQLAAQCYRQAFELKCTNNFYRESCQNCVKKLQLLEFGENFSSEQRKRMTMIFESANECIKCKNYNEAKALLEEILVINPDYFLYNAKYALVLHRLKMYKLAEKYFKKAIATDPTNSISRGVYGGMLFQLKRYNEAEEELKVCLAINPNNWICHQDYARLLEYKNDLRNAAFHSKKAFEINPSDHESYQRYQYLLKKIQHSTTYTISKSIHMDNISLSSSPIHKSDVNEAMDDSCRSQQSRHHTRHSIASTQSPQSGLHSPRSNYSSNNYAVSPTRTIVSVSSNHNNNNNNNNNKHNCKKAAQHMMNTMSLSSMYSYDDELQTMYTPPPECNERQNDFEILPNHRQNVAIITPRSTKSSIYNFSNNASGSTPSLHTLATHTLNGGFAWNEFDRAKQWMKVKNFVAAEPVLNDLVLSLTNNDIHLEKNHDNNIPYFDCIYNYAQCLYELNKFKDAIKYFKMALIYNANDSDCNYKYALLLKKLGKYTESRVYFEKCTQLAPYECDYFYHFGLLLQLIGDNPHHIIEQFEKAYSLKPDVIEFKRKLNEMKYKYNNSEALYNYSDSDADNCNDENTLQLARKYAANKDWDNADILYKELVDVYDNSDIDNYFKVLYEYASILREKGMFKLCAEYYEKAISVKNDDAICFYEYAKMLHYKLNDVDTALYAYEECLRLTKHTHCKCLFDCAILLAKKGKTADSIKYFEKCIAISENKVDLAQCHNEYGLLLRREAKYDSANKEFEIAISLDSARVDYLANYAYCFFLNERYKEAEVIILDCLDKDENDAFVNHIYALLLRRTNRFAEAFQYHHKAIELNPNHGEFKKRYDEFLEYSNRFSHEEKQKMKRKFDRAQMMIKSKHFDKARALLKQLSTVNPYNIVYVFKYAFVLHRLKQYKEAEKYYEMALNVEGDHSICHFDYGLMLSKLRRLEEAQYHYQRCLHMNPSDWICHINYARLLEKFGNFKDAAYHLEKALEINPNDAEAHQCYSQVVKKLKQQKHWTKKEKEIVNKQNKSESPWRRVTAPTAKKLSDTMSEQLEKATRKSPISNIYNLKNAKQLYEKGDYIKSKQIYKKLMENDANQENDDLYYELGLVLFKLHQWTESGDCFANALRLNPDNIEYNYQYALILEQLNDFQAAIIYFEKCGANYKDVETKLLLNQDEEIKKVLSLNDYRSAKQLLAQKISCIDFDINPNSFEYLLQYAQVLLKLNEFNESEKYYKIALKLKPNEPNCYYNLGIICEQRHRNAEATMYLEKAAALQPNNDMFRNRYNESVLKLQQQQRESQYFDTTSFGNLLCTNYTTTVAATAAAPTDELSTAASIDVDEIQNELNYNSYLFAPNATATATADITHSHSHYHHHHIHHHHHSAAVAAAATVKDDIFSNDEESIVIEGEISINEEKTVEETHHQSYCQKQRLSEFRWFLQEKVGFNSKHFEQYLRRFAEEGLADVRMLAYLDEATLSNMDMIPPHSKLLLDKIHDFKHEMRLFRNLFTDIDITGIPSRYYNVFADYGICCIDSFCHQFKNKNELVYILDNNQAIIDLLWTQIENIKINKAPF